MRKKTKGADNKPVNSVLSNVTIRSADRSPKDIQTWMNGIQSFESPTYPNQQRLFDIYTSILLDGFLGGIIDKRIDTVLNKTLFFEHKRTERRRNSNGQPVTGWYKADDFDNLIDSLAFRKMCKQILLTQMWGRSGLEFIPGAMEAFAFRNIPRKHIKMDTRIISFEQSDNEAGIPYEGIPNVWILGEPDDMGLLASVAQYALLKRGDLADWSNYVEIFGMPAWVFKYDAYDTQTKDALDKIIDNVGSALRIRIPRQADVEPMDGKTQNGDGALQEKLYNAMNAEMAIRILGNTETTSSSEGSGYAQSKTHSAQQAQITDSDISYLRAHLNSPQFLAILASYGYKVENGRFSFEKMTSIEALKEEAIIAKTLAIDIGLPLDHDQLYEKFGYTKPDNYDAMMAEMKGQGEEQEPKPGAKPMKKPASGTKLAAGDKVSFFRHVANFFVPARK